MATCFLPGWDQSSKVAGTDQEGQVEQTGEGPDRLSTVYKHLLMELPHPH